MISQETAEFCTRQLNVAARSLKRHTDWHAAVAAHRDGGPAPDLSKMPSKGHKVRMYGTMNWVLRTLGLDWAKPDSLEEIAATITRVRGLLAPQQAVAS